MSKYIKIKKGEIQIDTKNAEYQAIVSLISSSLRQPRKKSTEPDKEGEILVELVRALAKDSTKSFRSEFASLIGLKESGLHSALYLRNITGKHLANFLLQMANITAEEFMSEFLLFMIEKRTREAPSQWLKNFMKIKHLTEEEKEFISMVGLKFDEMIDNRK